MKYYMPYYAVYLDFGTILGSGGGHFKNFVLENIMLTCE